jgi:hypothetical protein
MQCACVGLYCHLWPVRLYNILQHYLINYTVLEKEIIEYKMFPAIFSTTLRIEPLIAAQVSLNPYRVDHPKYRSNLCRVQITRIFITQFYLTPSNILLFLVLRLLLPFQTSSTQCCSLTARQRVSHDIKQFAFSAVSFNFYVFPFYGKLAEKHL